MANNYFTEEQQNELQNNPYVRKVSAKSITYTKEFKEKFEEEYRGGKLPSQILSDMGLDPHMLGNSRKSGLVTRMKMYELRPEGFEDTRKNHSGRPAIKQLTDAEKIKYLEQKIAYLNQENEFLKKNTQMDHTVNWKYSRKHPSNTNSSKK